jgi:hypothetical protein
VEEFAIIVSTTRKDNIASNVFHFSIAIPMKTFKAHMHASLVIVILWAHLMMEFVIQSQMLRRKQKQVLVIVRRM